MKKKSLALVAIAVVIVASIVTTYTLAFFTDKDEKVNTFTVGNVDIILSEPLWTGGVDGLKANPGVAVPKNPMVTNDGANSAYVRLDVIVSDAAVFTTEDGDGKKVPYELFTANDHWILVDGYPQKSDDEKTWIYSYHYDKMLNEKDSTATGAITTTDPLFDDVTLPAEFDNDDVARLKDDNKDGFDVTVKAYAIQTAGFVNDATAQVTASDLAFAALEEAINPTTPVVNETQVATNQGQ